MDRLGSSYRRRSIPFRLGFAFVGVAALLFGLLLWSLEQEYGGWEGSGLGDHMVVGQDETTGMAVVIGDGGEVLFEGSSYEEADAWIDAQRSRDFTVPIVVMSAGAVSVLVAFIPWGRREPVEAMPVEGER
jgi:hypothetical protein